MGVLCLVLVLLFSTLRPSSFAIILMVRERAGCFTLTVFLMSCVTGSVLGSSSRCRELVCSVLLWHFLHFVHLEKSATILESNHGSGVCKEHST